MYITHWIQVNTSEIRLFFGNRKSFCIKKSDFDRAFGPILSSDYDSVYRDFFLHY